MFLGKLRPNYEIASHFNPSGKWPTTNLTAVAAEQINDTLMGEVATRLKVAQEI